jgi:DNA-directed RNA polymerase subunit M
VRLTSEWLTLTQAMKLFTLSSEQSLGPAPSQNQPPLRLWFEGYKMEFCSECGSRLVLKKVSSANQESLMLVCTKCHFKKEESQQGAKFKEKIIEHDPKQFVAVIGKDEQLSTLPTLSIECPRCGNKTANVWQVQTRGSDESSTQFFRCLQCGFTMREYT